MEATKRFRGVRPRAVVVLAAGACLSVAFVTPGWAAHAATSTSAVEATDLGALLVPSTEPRAQSPQAGGVVTFGGPQPPPVTSRGATAIAAALHQLAVVDGQVYAWGLDVQGETFVPDEAKSGVTDVAAGNAYSLALKSGRVIGWGSNRRGQLDVPEEAQSGVSAIAAGYTHALALKDGRVITWGSRAEGVGDVPVDAQSGVTAIAAGAFFSMALKDGRVIVWGKSDDFYGPANPRNLPAEVQTGVTAISATFYHAMALKNGGVIAWGSRNQFGELTVPSTAMSGVTAIATGWEFSSALKGGEVIVWGNVALAGPSPSGIVALAAGNSNLLGIQVAAPPGAPAGVTALAGDQEASVSWLAPVSDGGSPVTGYVVTSSPGGRTCSTTSELACTVTGLVNGTAYTFTVTASNAAGTSLASAPSTSVTPVSSVVKPGAVSNLRVTGARGAVRVTWSPPIDMGGASSVTYQYQVGKGSWKSTSVTAVTVKGKKGSRLTVKVRAVNEADFGPTVRASGIPR